MFTVPFILYFIALLLTIGSAVYPPRIPVWIPLLLVIVGLLVASLK